jgi:hypothetical protein
MATQTYSDLVQTVVQFTLSPDAAVETSLQGALAVTLSWRRLVHDLPVITPGVITELTFLLQQTQAGNVTALAILTAISQLTDNATAVQLQAELQNIAGGG